MSHSLSWLGEVPDVAEAKRVLCSRWSIVGSKATNGRRAMCRAGTECDSLRVGERIMAPIASKEPRWQIQPAGM